MTHTELANLILVTYGSHPRLRLWKNQSGLFLSPMGTRVRVGVKGASDILGIRDDGRLISIEVKVGRDHLRPEQENWRDMIRRYNGIWIEARSISDVEIILK